MTKITAQDLTRTKIATSQYAFTAKGSDRTFNVVWNWKNGADRWLVAEMPVADLVARDEAKNIDGIATGATLDAVKKVIVEALNTPVVEPESPAPKARGRKAEGRKPRPSRSKAAVAARAAAKAEQQA